MKLIDVGTIAVSDEVYYELEHFQCEEGFKTISAALERYLYLQDVDRNVGYHTKRIVAPYLPKLSVSQDVQRMCLVAERIFERKVHSVYLNVDEKKSDKLFSIVLRANIHDEPEEYRDTEIVVKTKDLNNITP